MRAVAFANPDSAIWRGTQATPGVDRLLGLDTENGFLAFVDTAGQPGWIDLRLGAIRRPEKGTYRALSSSDGWAIYGTDAKNTLRRLTPSGDWQSEVAGRVSEVIPIPDGSVLAIAKRGEGSALLSMRPPEDALTDSTLVPALSHAAVTTVGDRVYLGTSEGLVGVSPQALAKTEQYDVDGEITSIAPTPSGDRVFLAVAGEPTLLRLDRYGKSIGKSLELPGAVRELRIDPYGRYLLARPDVGDSVWVISVAKETLVGSVASTWRGDLPMVAVDGSIATVRGNDLVFVMAETNDELRRVPGGAADLWHFIRWNGFRPRARGIDQPVSFRVGAAPDSTPGDRPVNIPVRPAPTVRDTLPTPEARPTPPPPPPPTRPDRERWMVSFAAVLSLEKAREVAGGISVNGQRPRVITSEADGTPVYRVVIGPFESKAEAERVGRSSGHSYWVFEGGSP